MHTKAKANKVGMPLHQFIATGNKPKDFKGCKGVNANTIPGVKRSK